MSKQNNRALKIAAGVAFSFSAFVVIILVLIVKHVVTFQIGMLMLVALVGLYFGFGVLIAVYRFTSKLE
jgi:VIT1/CCC1 family predicted Fe2+/Mn2+ transporter